MIYSQKGDPWDFIATYKTESCQIEFRKMFNFFKDGPLCGQLYVNDKQVYYPQCDGFGGPPLITKEYLYTPVYQRNIIGFKDIIGAFIAEIDLKSLSVRIVGKKQEFIHIAYMDKGNFFSIQIRIIKAILNISILMRVLYHILLGIKYDIYMTIVR